MSRRNSFYNIAKELEVAPENEGYLIIIRCGAFFTSIGDNAIVLSDELHLRLTCFKKGICKIGVPISSLYDFVKKLDSIGYSYVIYNYSKDEMVNNGRKYTECYRFEGKYVDKSMRVLDCLECDNYNKNYDTIDIFTEMKKLQELKNANNMKNTIKKKNYEKRMYYLNLIDALLSTQRVMLRLMVKNRWIDEKKFKVSMEMLYEIGKILGGLIKQYAKNNKK